LKNEDLIFLFILVLLCELFVGKTKIFFEGSFSILSFLVIYEEIIKLLEFEFISGNKILLYSSIDLLNSITELDFSFFIFFDCNIFSISFLFISFLMVNL